MAEARRLLPSLLPMLAGWGVYLIGVHQLAPLAGLGLAAVAWGWTAFTGRFWRLVRASDLPDRLHAQVVAVASTAGAAALWLAAAGHVAGHEAAVRVALAIGLWWFIAPVYAAVLHRMIPFFTASAMPGLDAWRPMWLMWTWVACLVLARDGGQDALVELYQRVSVGQDFDTELQRLFGLTERQLTRQWQQRLRGLAAAHAADGA